MTRSICTALTALASLLALSSHAGLAHATCNASAAPTILDLEFDSVSFFYVTVDLANGNDVILGFEYDGDEWSWAEQYGVGGSCDGQLDTFSDYTLSILTSSSCAAAQVYTPAEEAAIAWYVGEVENACQDNQAPACYPVQTLALTAANTSSIPTTPNGCGSSSWCGLTQLRGWTIPLCTSTPATITSVTDLVLTVDQENSSLPWGTILDRAGLSGTRFLAGSGGASLFGQLDSAAGSTNVQGWDFTVQVQCHNCTEFDVKTVVYYPDTGWVFALDGYYGWDS